MTAPTGRAAAPVAILHAIVPGRIRLRVPAIHRAPALARRLEEALAARSELRGVSASAVTGSVLVLADPALTPDAVAALVQRALADARHAPGDAPQRDPRTLWLATDAPRAATAPQALLGRLRALLADPTLPGAPPADLPAMPQWHALPIDALLGAIGGSEPQGLDDGAILERRRRHGPNVLPTRPPRSTVALLVEQLRSPPVLLLAGSSVFSVLTGGVGDAVVILAVVALNAGIGTATERRAERTIGALTSAPVPPALVRRDGRAVSVPAAELVPGDVLLLVRGSYVAADARLVDAESLTVDESLLTGESRPVRKDPDAEARPDAPIGERRNMVFRGTLVTGGSGEAIVVATGLGTEVGQVQALILRESAPRTPLQRQLDTLGGQLVVTATALAGVAVVIGLLRRMPLLELARTAVALGVAAVPEGLPTVATTTLASGLRALRREGVLVRTLGAVEAIGAVHVVCLDKTGTVTVNRMRVVATVLAAATGADGAEAPGLPGAGAAARAAGRDIGAVDPETAAVERALLEAVALCSEAEPPVRAGEPPHGSPTECALLEHAIGRGVDVAALRAAHPLRRVDQRAETRMYMVTRHDAPDGGHRVAVKGRPDAVLARCAWIAAPDGPRLLTPADRARLLRENERLAAEAYRVLAVAEHRLAASEPDGEAGLTWLGLVALDDPVRDGIPALVARLRAAGVRTVMITGDQSATALAVARRIGLAGGEPLVGLDATELDALDEPLLVGLAARAHVFSRVGPAHKLRIVRALQAGGLRVAMTGDGVNDGPALRGADVGIAIGRGGTDVAREVADVVLRDDHLPAILGAIARGRAIREDLRKSVRYIATTNASELLFTIASLAAGLGPPLSPKQLLWINLVTDVLPEIALATDPPDGDVLDRPPGDADAPLVARHEWGRVAGDAGVMTAATMASYLYGIRRHGPGLQASTLGFNTLVAAQLLHTLSARSETVSVFDVARLPPNELLPVALGGGFSLQALAELVGWVRALVGVARLPLPDLFVALASAGGGFLAIESLKVLRRPADVPRLAHRAPPALAVPAPEAA
jgi:Ca2+-transporting ATPase